MDAYKECVKEKAMDLSIERAVTTIQPGQPLRLEGMKGRRLSVVRGALWITQDNDPRDPVVSAGQDFVFGAAGAVAQALGGPALVAMEEGSPRPTLLRSAAALLQGWSKARRREQTCDALRELTDRDLRDIGLRRSQIEFLAC
jgi:uncharacterized protein YjiS (DUF1127 family)